MKKSLLSHGLPIHAKIITCICSLFVGFVFFFYVNITDCYGATVSWNNTAGGNWSNPDNWSTGIVPGSADDVEIALVGSYVVTVDTNVDAMSVFVGTGVTLFVRGRTLNTSIVNSGLVLVQSTNTINGSFENHINGMVRILGSNYGSGYLNVANGFTNQGLIELTNSYSTASSTLRVANGVLLNEGTIKSLPGVSGGSRYLYAAVDNRGNLMAEHDMTVGLSGDSHSNSGTVDVSDGEILRFVGSTLVHSGGDYSGAGVMNLYGIGLQLDEDFVYAAGMPSLDIYSVTVSGAGRLLNQRGLTLRSSIVNTAFVNESNLYIQAVCSINGSFENHANGMVRILGSNYGSGYLNVANGFNNQGLIELTNSYSTASSSLKVHNGVLLNEGTIKSLPGVSGGSRYLYAALDNRGNLMAEHDMTVGLSGDTHSNSGTVDVAVGKVLRFVGSTLVHSGGDYSGTGVMNLYSIGLQLDEDLVYAAGMPSLDIYSVTVSGAGRLLNQRGLTLRSSIVNTAIVNESNLYIQAVCSINGSFDNHSNGVVRILGSNYGSGYLNVANGFTNQGLIELTNSYSASASTLRVDNGVLLNEGTIKSLPGVSGGSRYLYAALDNRGNLMAEHDMTVGLSGDSHSNSGTVDVADGKVLRFVGSTLVHSGGAYSGTGVMNLYSIGLQLDEDFVYAAGMPSLDIYSVTVSGAGRLLNQRGLTLRSSIVNTAIVNESNLYIQAVCSINGSFENHPNGMVRILGSNYGSGYLNVANGFTNQGLIELTNSYSASSSSLKVHNGVLLNEGTIKSLPGVSGGSRYLYAALDNRGNLMAEHDMTVGLSGDTHSNSGTVDVEDGKVLRFVGSTLVHSGGAYSGNGVMNLYAIGLQLDEDFVYAAGMPSLDIYSVTVSGAGRLLNQRGLTLRSSIVNTAIVNESNLYIQAVCSVNGSFDNHSNGVVRILGSNYGSGYLNVANGFTNQGLIELTNSYSASSSSLRVHSGVLLNEGTIKSLPGVSGGSRYLYAAVDNRGNLMAEQDMTVGLSGDTHSNSGFINISSGKKLRFIGGNTFFNKAGGNIKGAGTLDIQSATLSNNGHISPGLSLGALVLTGNISQDAVSNLNIEIGGRAAGSEYDQLKVSGAATLNGVLNINLANNFMPQIGDSFQVVTYGSHSGAFATVNPFTINGSLDWGVTYTPTGVQLGVIEGAEGVRLFMTAGPDPLPIFHELTYTLTVFNASQEKATNIALTDTLPSSALFASVSASQGSCVENSGTIACSLGELEAFSSATVTITVVPTFVNTITNTASVTSDAVDPNPDDNMVTLYTQVTDLPGDYDISDSPIDLGVTGISPNYYGNTADAVVTMSGIGFDTQSTVSLISKEGIEYHPEGTDVDSLFQLTTLFDLSLVPVGRYDVKVSNQTDFRRLENAFEVIETQKANLETHLILPGSFGRHAVATIYIEYENTGNVSMPAPMLMLRSADEDDSDKPLLTLDASRIVQNLWTSTMPVGVGHTVQFLADGDGDSPGMLQPGESGRMPVYYTGLLRPWDFSDSSVELEIKIIKADEETLFDWESRKAAMKPESMDDQAWDILFANLVGEVGDTWGDYITALSENAVYLYRHCNQTVRDINELFRFELAQAMGASHPLPYLAGDADIAIAAPGLPLVFSRSFSSSISDRFKNGILGKGWTHSWQTSLAEDAEGNVIIASMNRERRYQPDTRGGYFSPPGDYSTLSKSGDIFTLIFPSGITQRFREDGKLDYLEDLNGNRITAEYSVDLLSRLAHSSGQYLSFTYSGGRITTINDHTGELSVDFAYDLFGDQLTSVTDILRRTTNYLYSQTGASAYAMAGVVYPDNTEESFSYDQNGRLSETVFNSIPQASFSYDLGAVTMTANADNSSHGFYYDAKGQLVKYVDPLGGVTVSAFDNNYNLLRVIGPDGLSASLTYDRNGNTTTVTDALGQLVKIGYGDFNRMNSISDAAVNTTDFYYDSQGNNDSVTYPDSSQKVYSFDFLGNLTQRTNRRGSAVGYSYDYNGFVLQKTYDDGATVAYSYDEVGNITSVTDLTGTTTFTYYENHLLQRITYPRNLFLEYTYDSLGRRSSVIDQSGYKLQYAYNAYGQLESIVQGEGQPLVNYTYDSMRRLSVKTLGNGVATAYEYDLAGRLIHLVNYAADDSILSRFDYEFDVRGRRTGMATLDGNWVYTYDKVGQLVEAIFTSSHSDIADKSISYTYDKAGNRTQEIFDGSSIDYVPNNMNQYSQAGNVTFNYDNDGNLISKTIGNDVWQYSYNDDNKLVAVLGPEGASEYQYDGLGNLTAVTENGTTTYYLIDPTGFGNVVGEYDESGALITRYTYGMGLISKDDYFYTFDGNGNTAELTNGISEEVNSYAYVPFGEVLFSNESVNNEFQFVGQFGIRQADNDLLYMRNRFYMPSTGRFISEDPIGIAGGLNLYGYVHNDPINYIDPYGLSARDAIKGLYFGVKATGAVTTEVVRIVAKDIAVAITGSYLEIPFVIDKAMTGMSIYGDAVGLGELGIKVSDKITSIRDDMYNEQPYQKIIPEIHMPENAFFTCLE